MAMAENQVKEMIIEKYGSLKKFSEVIDIPWTTLNSILKRGFDNSNIINVMKISKELGIDTEGLASGKVAPAHISSLSNGLALLDEYRPYIDRLERLDDVDRERILERMDTMLEADKYSEKEKSGMKEA